MCYFPKYCTYDGKSGTLVATTNNVRYNVPYLITSGTVNEISIFCDSASAIVLFTSDKSGELILDIPRSMLDTRHNNIKFFVLLDGEEINFEETSHVNSREIAIQFDPGSYDLEIISAWGIISLDIEKFACKTIHNPPYSHILPPLKQFKSGVQIDEINCREDLVKVVKKSDNMPACIKSESKSKLIQRDWIKFQFSFCGADGFDSRGNLNKSNSTHHWDENECGWEYVGPVTNSINKWSGDVPENDKWCNTELIVKTKEKIDQELLKLILLDEIAKFGVVYDMQDRDILLTDMGKNKTKISMDGSWKLKQDRPDIVKALTELIFVDHVEEYHGRLLVVSCQ